MLRATISLQAIADAAGWHELLMAFEHRGPTGRVEKVTSEQLDEIARNFSMPVPVGYNHALLSGAKDPESTAASGWIEQVEQVGGKLRAFIRWTAKAAERIKAGEFKFLSAEIMPAAAHPDPKEKKSIGSKLLGAALTNMPFVEGLAPVALSATMTAAFAEEPMPDDEAKCMCPECPRTDCIRNGKDGYEKKAAAAGEKPDEGALSNAVDPAQVQALTADNAAQATQVKALSDDLAALRKQLTTAEHSALLERSIAANRIAPGEKAAAMAVLTAQGIKLFDLVYPVGRKATLAGAAPIGSAPPPGTTEAITYDVASLRIAEKIRANRAEGKGPMDVAGVCALSEFVEIGKIYTAGPNGR